MILDTDRIVSDGAYRDEMRHRFMSDHFFAAEVMGFKQFNRRLHGPAVDLFFPKNPNVPIEDQDPIKFRMHLDPRHTFKTTLGLVDTAQWLAAWSSKLTLLYETATQPLAASMMNVTITHFQRGLLAQLFPEVTFTKRQREDCYDADTRNDPSIDPTVGYTSPKSAQSGWHPYLINADDVCDALNSGLSATDDSRQRLIDVHDTNKNTLRTGGYLNIRGTRYHPFELYGHELRTMNPKRWKVLVRASVTVKSGDRLLPGEFPDEDDLILNFPELPDLTYEALRDKFYANYETFMCQQQNDPQGGAVPTFPEKEYVAALVAPEKIPPIGDTFICWRLPYGGKPYMATYAEGAAARLVGGKVYVLDTWKGIYPPSGLAEKIVKAYKTHDAEACFIEEMPGTEYMGAHIRNEALRKNVSLNMRWLDFQEDDNYRIARMKQAEPLIKAGRLLFSTGMAGAAECHKQFVHFGLVSENGVVDCISRMAERVPISLLRANMTDEEIEWQMQAKENAQWNHVFNQQGIPAIDERAQQQLQASMMAMEATNSFGLPSLPGGLDG